MSVKLLTKHHLEFLSLKGGCTGSSDSTLAKMPHCWKSHAMAQTRRTFCLFQALRSNMYVTASEGFDKTPSCDICEVGNKAIERCLDCEENLCTGCLTFHHKMKATRAHRTSPIGNVQYYHSRET